MVEGLCILVFEYELMTVYIKPLELAKLKTNNNIAVEKEKQRSSHSATQRNSRVYYRANIFPTAFTCMASISEMEN
jgi:hypothetical protein